MDEARVSPDVMTVESSVPKKIENETKDSDGLGEVEGTKESDSLQMVGNTSTFKVPEDIAFKRPIFTKPTAKKNVSLPEKSKESKESASEKVPVAEESPTPTENVDRSPAQLVIEKSVPLPYKEPPWSGLPKDNYFFEILKNGAIIGTIPLDKPFSVVGRLSQCDIVMEHPSLSRFHCVIQYRAEISPEGDQVGFYAYDLGSTHGSFHNKHRMKPHYYYRLHVGHLVKFGGSSRTLIMQGPEEDQEPESPFTVTELMAKAAERSEKLSKLETGEIEEEDRDRSQSQEEEATKEESSKTSDGIDWGMGDDAEEDEEEGEESINPFSTMNEELYLDDPKKSLRGWFEREGYDLPEYVTEDVSPGVYRCKVELPIPGPGGGPLVAIVEHRGRKKAAVIQCALEACRLLDKQGVLRQATHESRKRKKDSADNDYYSDSDDEFLDRTGDIQRKRLQRMKAASKADETQTYESLMTKYRSIITELSSLEKLLADASQRKQALESNRSQEEDLDLYMKTLKTQEPDKHKRVMWKLRVIDLRKEELSVRRLVNVARPYNEPEIQPYISQCDSKPNVPAKHPFKRPDSTKQKTSLKDSKDVPLRVHHAFLEEEPERKIKLSRLDDET